MNLLIEQRSKVLRASNEHKEFSKKIKKRVIFLRNEKLAREASELNDYSNRRQVEELYSSFKSDHSSFKEHKSNQKCDPIKLREYFKKHFTAEATDSNPVELDDAPMFLEQQRITTDDINSGPPGVKEIVDVISKLKDGKSASDVPSAFIKHALDCEEFKAEIVKLYGKIWETGTCPRSWGHSKLVTLWKGPSKGKANDPSTYRGLQIGSSLCKILIVIIINRLKAWYELQLLDQQQGFRSARGTTDGIFVVKNIQQITNKITYLHAIYRPNSSFRPHREGMVI